MRINHNNSSLNAYRQLSANSAQGRKSLEQLSAGLRINKSGGAVAGLTVAEQMRARIIGQVPRNLALQENVSTTQTAQTGLDTINDAIQQMRELAVTASNGLVAGDERAAIQEKYEALARQIDQTANTTTFNSQKLLDGTGSITVAKEAVTPEISNLVKASGDGETYSMALGDFRVAALGVADLDFSTAQGAKDALDKLDAASDQISDQRRDLSKVELYSQLGTARENQASSDSRIRDVDMAQEMLEFTKTNLLNQAATSMLAQANQQSQGVLQLLR